MERFKILHIRMESLRFIDAKQTGPNVHECTLSEFTRHLWNSVREQCENFTPEQLFVL